MLGVQQGQVLRHMMSFPSGITGIEMVTLYGALNYKNVIFELRQKGVPIAGEWEIKTDHEGKEIKRWMRYYIPSEYMEAVKKKKW